MPDTAGAGAVRHSRKDEADAKVPACLSNSALHPCQAQTSRINLIRFHVSLRRGELPGSANARVMAARHSPGNPAGLATDARAKAARCSIPFRLNKFLLRSRRRAANLAALE